VIRQKQMNVSEHAPGKGMLLDPKDQTRQKTFFLIFFKFCSKWKKVNHPRNERHGLTDISNFAQFYDQALLSLFYLEN
jgi:hypothetical protein